MPPTRMTPLVGLSVVTCGNGPAGRCLPHSAHAYSFLASTRSNNRPSTSTVTKCQQDLILRGRRNVRSRVATGDDQQTFRNEKRVVSPLGESKLVDVVDRREARPGRLHGNSNGNCASKNEAMLIRGGNQLSGQVEISGSKNAALALLAASLLSNSPKVTLSNVPLQLTDVRNMIKVLNSLGVGHSMDLNSDTLELDCSSLTSVTPNSSYVKALRASFLVTGPLLARVGEARVPLPGGCKIGSRPVDLHLKGLEKLGADIDFSEDFVHVSIPKNRRLRGSVVRFDYPSVGATETVMMAACYAEGTTTIQNAAMEPEVEELGNFLMQLIPGVTLRGLGTGKVVISGVSGTGLANSSSSGTMEEVAHSVIPDRIEAGTFLSCGAITGSESLTLKGVHYPHVHTIAAVLRDMGCEIVTEMGGETAEGSSDLVICSPKHGGLKAVPLLETSPYPGFPTDMQPLLCSLLSVAKGDSVVKETVFENRMSTCTELLKMGAAIDIASSTAYIQGKPEGLVGNCVSATDLRAGVALILAGLAAKGETIVCNMSHVDRGYVNLEEKLRTIGADVERICIKSSS